MSNHLVDYVQCTVCGKTIEPHERHQCSYKFVCTNEERPKPDEVALYTEVQALLNQMITTYKSIESYKNSLHDLNQLIKIAHVQAAIKISIKALREYSSYEVVIDDYV